VKKYAYCALLVGIKTIYKMDGTYIKKSKLVLSELNRVMLEVTFIDCSPTYAGSLLTNRLELKRFWAYRSDSKNFRKQFSLRNL